MADYVGVDGCRLGWVAAWLTPDGGPGRVELYRTFAAVITATTDAALVLVDMPMGLPEDAPERACDRTARALLGPRRTSVFRVPVRAAVYASGYAQACAVSQQATGRKISQQSWNICRKIAEVDALLRATPALQARLRECHPEVCFAALSGWRPMWANKKTSEGQAERLDLLERWAPGARATLAAARAAYRRADVADDDIVDALVLAVSARLAHAAEVPSLPAEPAWDPCGLRMEIVSPVPPPR